MEEPVRFADVLFTLLTLAITFSILYLVNKVRNKSKQPPSVNSSEVSGQPTTTDSPGNDAG